MGLLGRGVHRVGVVHGHAVRVAVAADIRSGVTAACTEPKAVSGFTAACIEPKAVSGVRRKEEAGAGRERWG